MLYTLALGFALPFILMRLWWRGRREPGYRQDIAERLGEYKTDRPPNLVWIHAVSVGEVRAAAPLVQALRHALPGHAVLVTCTTAAGRETLKQVYGESVLSSFLPYDYPGAVASFLEHFRPLLAILMETEIWPNLAAGCAANGVPMLLANARMSEKSMRGYARWQALTGPAFRGLAAVCAQSEGDAGRLRALGAPNVEVTGNLKFDVSPDPQQVSAGREWRRQLDRPVLLLASTREGEEKLLLEELSKSAGEGANFLTVVVPRHPQRFDEVAQLTDERRSLNQTPQERTRTYLGDTMGEMAFYYAGCDVAVIGGSFAPLGGQNLIEALAVGTPVIAGPSMYNFSEAKQLALDAGAAVQAMGAASAVALALDLLKSSKDRARMSEAGKKLCAQHRGATGRHMEFCLDLLLKAANPSTG